MARRVIAALLCAAMVFSSESFSVAASAEPAVAETQIEIAEETAEEAPAQEILPDETGGQTVADEPEDKQDADAGETSSDETQDSEDTPAGQDAQEAEPGEGDAPEDQAATEDVAAEELPEDEILMEYAEASDIFVVTDGVLALKDGVSFPATGVVTIPKEAVRIPAGIFNSADVPVVKVLFEEESLLETIDAGAFQNSKIKSISLPSNLTSIGDSAFEDSAVTEIEIPAGVTVINDKAFKGAVNLAKVTFKGNVTSIGQEAFKLTQIANVKADALTEIKAGAFEKCKKLTTFSTGSSLQVIGDDAFGECTLLKTFSWSAGLKSIGARAFSGCGFTALQLDVIGSDEISIGNAAFSGCASLQKVESLPVKLKVIPVSMFESCAKMTSVTFPKEVTTIKTKAFSGCKNITRIVFPASVSVFESQAFEKCSGLETIIFQHPDPSADAFRIEDGAFPKVSSGSHLMKGYDGKVEEYAEKNGYSFETLYPAYNIKYTRKENMEVGVSHASGALPGTVVTVTFRPAEGYTLLEGSVYLECDRIDKAPDVGLYSYTDQAIQYRFKMPADDVQVKYTVKKREEAISGKLAATIEPLNGSVPYQEKDVTHIEKAGQEAQIKVVDGKENPVGAWLLNFRSDNTNIVSVDNKGTLLAKGKGETKIKISKKDSEETPVTLKVAVDESTTISAIELVGLETADPISIPRARIGSETIDGTVYPVISFEKTAVHQSARTFELSFKAYEGADRTKSYKVSSTWKSVDTGVASVSAATSTGNSNVITVKKGALGESMITITVKTGATDITKSVLIRVVDATPRITDTSISVNVASSIGTPIHIVPVYGYEIAAAVDMEVIKLTVKNGSESTEKFDDYLVVDMGSGEYCLKGMPGKVAAGETLKYAKGTLCISGMFLTGEPFTIPLPEVTITNKALNPAVKLAGKLNLFYLGSDANAGEVTLTQSLDKETVTAYELMSEENYIEVMDKRPVKANDQFVNNYAVTQVNNTTFKIVRTDNPLEVDEKGKPIVSGYIKFQYAGYSDPVYKKIKIPTENKKPAYVLSMTSATVNKYNSDLEIPLQILDKKTKKPLLLDPVTKLDLDESSGATTTDNFAVGTPEADGDGNVTVIPLTLAGDAVKGKAVINLQLANWSEPLKYTFTLNVTSSLPKVKLSAGTLTLNALWKGEAFTKLVWNQKLSPIEQATAYLDDLEFAGTGEEPDDLDISIPGDDDTITAVWRGEAISGRYKYRVTPYISYGSDEIPLKPITFQVVVKNTKPSLKLKTNTFVFNANYPGLEEAKTTYQFVNLPEGSSAPAFVTTDMTITPVKETSPLSSDLLQGERLTFSEDDRTVAAKLNSGRRSAFSYEYIVRHLKVKVPGTEDADAVELQEFKIKVQGKDAKPSVAVKAKGTLNPVDPASEIVYTATIKGINGGVKAISAYELDANGAAYKEGGHEVLKHFTADLVDGTQQISVKVKPGEVLDATRTYKLKLKCELEALSDEAQVNVNVCELQFKPKQSIPKVKADQTSAYFYAGQNSEKTVQVTIEKTGKDALKAKDAAVVFADGTDDGIKKAFKIEAVSPVTDPVTGITTTTMTLRLVNSTPLVLNKKYTLNLEVRYEGQMENTKGSAFKLDVTVRK